MKLRELLEPTTPKKKVTTIDEEEVKGYVEQVQLSEQKQINEVGLSTPEPFPSIKI